MEYFISGTNIDVEIPFVDDQGEAIAPTSAAYKVLDQDGVEVASGSIVDADVNKEATVTVISAVNTLADGNSLELREIILTMTLADGSKVVAVARYFLETSSDLIISINSTMNYANSLIHRMNFAMMPAWDTADERSRKMAMVEAFNNLGLLKLRPNDYGITSLRDMTSVDYDDGSDFVRDFRLAQFAEAEQLMGSNGIEDLRRAGILSSSIGEVTQFYRTSKPVELSVHKESMKHIGKYINLSVNIGRA